jgi:hypothetical protein
MSPLVSESQRRWMHATHPLMAKRWEEHTPAGAKLPEHVKKKKKLSRSCHGLAGERPVKYFGPLMAAALGGLGGAGAGSLYGVFKNKKLVAEAMEKMGKSMRNCAFVGGAVGGGAGALVGMHDKKKKRKEGYHMKDVEVLHYSEAPLAAAASTVGHSLTRRLLTGAGLTGAGAIAGAGGYEAIRKAMQKRAFRKAVKEIEEEEKKAAGYQLADVEPIQQYGPLWSLMKAAVSGTGRALSQQGVRSAKLARGAVRDASGMGTLAESPKVSLGNKAKIGVGQFMKNHPVASAGIGAGTVAGAGYVMGRHHRPQEGYQLAEVEPLSYGVEVADRQDPYGDKFFVAPENLKTPVTDASLMLPEKSGRLLAREARQAKLPQRRWMSRQGKKLGGYVEHAGPKVGSAVSRLGETIGKYPKTALGVAAAATIGAGSYLGHRIARRRRD